jgi:hypothetical protein
MIGSKIKKECVQINSWTDTCPQERTVLNVDDFDC